MPEQVFSPRFWMSRLRLREEKGLVPGHASGSADSGPRRRPRPSPGDALSKAASLAPRADLLVLLSSSKTPSSEQPLLEDPSRAKLPAGWRPSPARALAPLEALGIRLPLTSVPTPGKAEKEQGSKTQCCHTRGTWPGVV